MICLKVLINQLMFCRQELPDQTFFDLNQCWLFCQKRQKRPEQVSLKVAYSEKKKRKSELSSAHLSREHSSVLILPDLVTAAGCPVSITTAIKQYRYFCVCVYVCGMPYIHLYTHDREFILLC